MVHRVEDMLRAVAHALVISRQHLEPGHDVMAECDRLRGLQMREPGQDAVRLAFGEVEHSVLQAPDGGTDLFQLGAQPQADIGCDLVVA